MNPTLSGTLDLTGSAEGRLQISIRDALKPQPRVAVRGNARGNFGAFSGNFSTNLEGVFPALNGKLEATLPSLPAGVRSFALEGNGSGTYRVSGSALNGSVTLKTASSLAQTTLSGKLGAKLELAGLLEGASGRVAGEVVLDGTIGSPQATFDANLVQPRVATVELGEAKLTGAFKAGKLSLKGVYPNGGLTWDGSRLTATNYPVNASGFALKVDATGAPHRSI
ncbi:MAG: hypothetical protein HC933_05650 [Pleurocapsa sp. SU_196_0]|nr:hypothetical protein [Pleurocapsa sp. SU_196_0]